MAITWIYLKGSDTLIRERLQRREHHFMKAQMLASQLADLEEAADAIVIDVAVKPAIAVRQIVSVLRAALRSCRRCGRQQCRQCWDNANGECSRCHWLVDDLPATLRERGALLQGEGDPQVVWNGTSLDFESPLPDQGVRPNDVLRVSTIALNG